FRHLCGFLHRCLLKSHPKSPKVVQKLLLVIGAMLLDGAIAGNSCRFGMCFDMSNCFNVNLGLMKGDQCPCHVFCVCFLFFYCCFCDGL
ncbi:hypothetical protein AB205_0185020, partial [Aquarana catesbeiana]